MSLGTYLRLMGFTSLIACGIWLYVLFTINPFEAGVWSLILFYITLFLALVGSLATVGALWRVHKITDQRLLFRQVKIAFRHSVLLSSVALISLILSAQALLRWWNFFALIIGIGVIEYLSLIVDESRRS